MSITRPTSDQLIQAAHVIKEKYAKNGLPEKPLIKLLEILHDFIKVIKLSNTCPPEDELQKICLGIWTYCIECTPADSDELLEPFKTWQIPLTDEGKLKAIGKFYHFLFNEEKIASENKEKLEKLFHQNTFCSATVESRSIQIMKSLLKRISKDITNIINGIPTEKAIDTHMSNMEMEYKNSKETVNKNKSTLVSFLSLFTTENTERKFYTQLCTIMASVQIGDKNNLPRGQFSRSHNIKNGLFLFLIHSIENEYYMRYPTNSGFHNTCKKILNSEEVENLSAKRKAIAVATLQNFLRDMNWIEYLENQGRMHFKEENLLKDLDIKFNQIGDELTHLMNVFLQNENKTNWPLTTTMFKMGGYVGKVIGYGVGWATGLGVSKTNSGLKPKIALAKCMSSAGTAILGSSGGYLGFLAADFMVESTAAYGAALVLQQIGIVVAGLTTAAIAFPIELTYKGIHHACNYFFDLCKDIDPILIQHVDLELIECLRNLPPEAFSSNKKNKMAYLLGEKSAEIALVTTSLSRN